MIYIDGLVILLTALLVIGVAAHVTSKPAQTQTPRQSPAPLPGELPRAGRFDVEYHNPPFAGASQTGQPFDLLTVLADALTIAERQLSQAEVTRDLALIELEIELNPEKYR